jgi:predicted  nucleic acid-binding Zn-ribbon protein
MELTHACRSCGAVSRVPDVESVRELHCAACGDVRAVPDRALRDGLAACPCCGCDDFYRQKDFPQALGLVIVVVGFAISTVFWYYERPLWTYAILLASALLDMVLYYKVPNVTICYRCLAQYRGPGANPGGAFAPFDLGVGERYRQERLRVEEHRRNARADVGRGDGLPPP